MNVYARDVMSGLDMRNTVHRLRRSRPIESNSLSIKLQNVHGIPIDGQNVYKIVRDDKRLGRVVASKVELTDVSDVLDVSDVSDVLDVLDVLNVSDVSRRLSPKYVR